MATNTKWQPTGGNNSDRIGGNGYEFSYTDDQGNTKSVQFDFGTMFSNKKTTGYESFMPEMPVGDDIVITHGHADHIGGISHLLNLKRTELQKKREAGQNLTIHCSAYAEAMIRNSLASDKIPVEEFPVFKKVEPGKPFKLNGFKIEPFAVSHSIPEALGYVVESPDGVRMMTCGDFKTAPVPLGKGWDDKIIAEVASKGIDFMFVDSTSAGRDGIVDGENEVRGGIKEAIARAEGGMIVSSMIASSAHRLYTVARAAAEYSLETGTDPRTIILDGASLLKARTALNKCGYNLESMIKEQTGVDIKIVASNTKTAQETPANQKFCVCTGTQGEEASFVKVARGENKNISLDVDCPVFVYNLQTCIPGSEARYANLEKMFKEKGCTTFFPDRYNSNEIKVHASGHAGSGDVEKLCEIVGKNSPRQTKVVPIHGSTDQRKKVMEIAQKAGLKAFIVPNFEAIKVDANGGVSIEKAQKKETWIGINDVNNNFLYPKYQYDRVVHDTEKETYTKAETLKYKRAEWKKKEYGAKKTKAERKNSLIPPKALQIIKARKVQR